MINESQAKKYCKDDISKIENYDKAIEDKRRSWHIHHRAEILPCGRFSVSDLMKFNLYWDRPANELIFLTQSEHMKLHHIGVKPMLGKSWQRTEVEQFTKDGEFIQSFASINKAQHKTGINKASIIKCCNGKLKSAGSYIWRYKK